MLGKTISHYKILEKIGSGGMGIVYKARDLKLGRSVALKFLPRYLINSEEDTRRFVHEAKAASVLNHNNICAIYAIDETVEGQKFIAMAHYDGETLDKRIKKEPLSITDVIDIASQIAQGLAKAHENDVVHRDIKPANIMLTHEGIVKILDFGLAKISTQTKLPREGAAIGTISYMSPEQARGTAIDHRTDIWSFGVILYEMICGSSPFRSDYDAALVYSIINEEIEPVTKVRSDVPVKLEQIISKCLQKDPAHRFQNIEDILEDLRQLQQDWSSFQIAGKEVSEQKSSKKMMIFSTIIIVSILLVAGYFLIYHGAAS